MATYAQHRQVVSVDNASGVLTDISAGVTSVTGIGFSNNIGAHHTFGSDWEQKTVGGSIVSDITIEVRGDTSTSTAHDLFLTLATAASYATRAASTTVRVDEPDSSVGSRRSTVEAYLKSYMPAAAAAGSGEVKKYTAVMAPTGAPTVATIT